tara:strand:- start:53 stop:280 length:228 start_codon:yes stop_codon:yes gene_type:complete
VKLKRSDRRIKAREILIETLLVKLGHTSGKTLLLGSLSLTLKHVNQLSSGISVSYTLKLSKVMGCTADKGCEYYK